MGELRKRDTELPRPVGGGSLPSDAPERGGVRGGGCSGKTDGRNCNREASSGRISRAMSAPEGATVATVSFWMANEIVLIGRDEMPYKKSEKCSLESVSVSTECEDHLCPRKEWSCGRWTMYSFEIQL